MLLKRRTPSTAPNWDRSTYVTGIKWVSLSGELGEASETTNPKLLRDIRASYGPSSTK